MKISHSIIVLTSIIFVTGSMITVGMDLKRTTDNISTNVVEAKLKHDQSKTVYLNNTKNYEAGANEASNKNFEADLQKNRMNKQKTADKLKSLNQQSSRSANKFL